MSNKNLELDNKIKDILILNSNKKIFSNLKKNEINIGDINLFEFEVEVKLESEKMPVVKSGGISEDESKSILITLCEGLERYYNSKINYKQLIISTYSDLNKNKIELEDINHKTDIDIKKFKKEKINWIECTNLNKEKKYFPAQMIYMPFYEDDVFIRKPISTGSACGSSLNNAIINGACECIERDHFMTCYLNKENPFRINNENIKDKKIRKLINEIENSNIKVNLFKLNKDKEISTILCVLENQLVKKYEPVIVIGCSCEVDINLAIKKSLFEAIKTKTWVQNLINYNKDKFLNTMKPNQVQNILERAFFWSHKQNKKYLDFILKTKKDWKNLDTPNNEKKIDTILKYLKKNNLELYYKKLSEQELENIDLFVVKVVIPKMQPLYLFENFKYDKGPKIKKIDEINDIPHPFL